MVFIRMRRWLVRMNFLCVRMGFPVVRMFCAAAIAPFPPDARARVPVTRRHKSERAEMEGSGAANVREHRDAYIEARRCAGGASPAPTIWHVGPGLDCDGGHRVACRG